MRTIPVAVGEGYKVLIGSGLLEQAGELLIQQSIEPCKTAIVTDCTVGSLYAATVKKSLAEAGFATSLFAFADGEQSKTMQTLSDTLEFLASRQLTRTDCVIALGGGVVGDLAGFAAACYMRGIRYVQMPTNLLAAIDSSVGGKTGLDLSAGKNLAGIFWQPSAVLCDTNCFTTLPTAVLLDGLAEVIKTAILGNPKLFSLIENGPSQDSIEDIIAQCVTYKAGIVEEDEREKGVRKSLNLGHTVGHAIEACSNYTITHGHAVATGTAIVTRAAAARGICDADDARRILELLARLGFTTHAEFTTPELVQAILHDKKRAGDRITLVFPEKIGSFMFYKTTLDDLEDLIDDGRGEAP
ncbi:MAG: 3-dehydroquinate synthase [Coriobacteriia bacterium]|nr:3-dehydroquinate synthase [Coriobacteriia bacterium]